MGRYSTGSQVFECWSHLSTLISCMMMFRGQSLCVDGEDAVMCHLIFHLVNSWNITKNIKKKKKNTQQYYAQKQHFVL